MIGRITVAGLSLEYLRPSGEKTTAWNQAKCIYSNSSCGTGCSHFLEPVPSQTKIGKTELQLCQIKITFDKFYDERKGEKPKW